MPVLSPFRAGTAVQAHADSLEGVNVGHFVVLEDGAKLCFRLVTAIDYENHLVTLSAAPDCRSERETREP